MARPSIVASRSAWESGWPVVMRLCRRRAEREPRSQFRTIPASGAWASAARIAASSLVPAASGTSANRSSR